MWFHYPTFKPLSPRIKLPSKPIPPWAVCCLCFNCRCCLCKLHLLMLKELPLISLLLAGVWLGVCEIKEKSHFNKNNTTKSMIVLQHFSLKFMLLALTSNVLVLWVLIRFQGHGPLTFPMFLEKERWTQTLVGIKTRCSVIIVYFFFSHWDKIKHPSDSADTFLCFFFALENSNITMVWNV